MADYYTEARPYAKAIFALAKEQHKLHEWANALDMLSLFTLECQKYYVLKNPKFRKQQKINLFLDPAHAMSKKVDFPEAENLLRLLMLQRRLLILPQITKVFHTLLNEHENILDAKVETVMELSSHQKKRIIAKLEHKYQRKIQLTEIVNPKLIGGAIITAGDRVLDGSILGKLKNLKESLA